jgi:hypothetical protein
MKLPWAKIRAIRGLVPLALILTSAVGVFGYVLLHRPPVRPVLYDATRFRDGDIIFRRGVSVESEAIMAVDGGGAYSHAGIVKFVDGQPQVIHVTANEPPGSPNVTRIEPLAQYLEPARASAAAVYRVRNADRQFIAGALSTADGYVKARIPFDSAMDLNSAGAMYCTELVWRAYREAGLDLVDGKFENMTTPLLRGQVILPGTLRQSPHLEMIWTSD